VKSQRIVSSYYPIEIRIARATVAFVAFQNPLAMSGSLTLNRQRGAVRAFHEPRMLSEMSKEAVLTRGRP